MTTDTPTSLKAITDIASKLDDQNRHAVRQMVQVTELFSPETARALLEAT